MQVCPIICVRYAPYVVVVLITSVQAGVNGVDKAEAVAIVGLATSFVELSAKDVS